MLALGWWIRRVFPWNWSCYIVWRTHTLGDKLAASPWPSHDQRQAGPLPYHCTRAAHTYTSLQHGHGVDGWSLYAQVSSSMHNSC